MQRDWGSRDRGFIAMNREVRERLLALAGAEQTHVCVPLQGSGTFTVEAVIGTLLPRDGKLLVLVNGAYGQRMLEIARVMGRSAEAAVWPEDETVDPGEVERRLRAGPAITHVAVVHCETTSGILNPVGAVAEVVAAHGLPLIIDSMSAFGAIPLDAGDTPFGAVAASANKCLEGVPGMGFALVDRELLQRSKGNSHSLSLDLYSQWRGFEKNGQWRFTPPTHVVAALLQALDEHAAEGGVAGRGARYANNHRLLVDGMEALGFQCLLAKSVQAPIIVTFLTPADPRFEFVDFYERLSARGFVIYPGKLTVADSFRIGCIGRLGEAEMKAALEAIRAVLHEMGVSNCAPARSVRPVA